MLIGRIPGMTRLLGKTQGYAGLPVRDKTVIDPVTKQEVNMMSVAFEPTPDEIERIVKGGRIYLSLLCVTPPPMLMDVGPVPDEDNTETLQ